MGVSPAAVAPTLAQVNPPGHATESGGAHVGGRIFRGFFA